MVGGGLAGSLLAWRLASATTWRIDLIAGERCDADATAASGGAVRAYEADPEQRRLAAVSLVELLASATLRRWADYRPVHSIYLRHAGPGLADEVSEIEELLPGSATVVAPADLAALGLADVPDDGAAVVERRAGYVSPARLRDAVRRDAATHRSVSVRTGAIGAISPGDDGIACEVGGERHAYDVVVLATGAWTPGLLRANGLAADGYRAKSIQYGVHPVGDWCPPQFIDDIAGVYGRPTADGGLLVGVPTDRWDVDPDRPPIVPDLFDRGARLAAARFPRLRLGPATRQVSAADCYTDTPGLALRPVGQQPLSGHRLLTFTGGSGGSVKTALAASQLAATQLASAGA